MYTASALPGTQTHAINKTCTKIWLAKKWKALMKPKGRRCHRRASTDRLGHRFIDWCLLQIPGGSKINLKGVWTESRHFFLVQLLNYSKAAVAQVAELQMAELWAGRPHAANCRHCHVQCQCVADRVCGAWLCWQEHERTCVWYYSSGLMGDKTKAESISTVTHKSSNGLWNNCKISKSQQTCR